MNVSQRRERAFYFRHTHLTKRLEKELEDAQRLNNLRLYRQVRALLQIHEGWRVVEIATFFRVSEKTIYDWLTLFIVERFDWLGKQHYQGRGRKPRLNKQQRRRLYEIVAAGPEKAGFTCGIWNSAMILAVVQKEFGVTYNPRYLCDLLHQLGLSYQKAKFASDRMEDADHLRARHEWDTITWPRILQKARKLKGVILFGDEVSFAQWGSLARTWAPRGRQPVVKTCGKRKSLKMFGAIEFFSGKFFYQECADKFNAVTYRQFLTHLLENNTAPIFLIEDGAPYHRNAELNLFKEKMRAAGRLFMERLPTYSPDKNPIEKLWKNTKKLATHLKYFPTFDLLRAAVLRTFQSYLKDAMQIICVMKKLRRNIGLT